MSESSSADLSLEPRQICEKLSRLGASFNVKRMRSSSEKYAFRMLPDEQYYPLEMHLAEEALVAIAMADAYLLDLISLNDLGLARIVRVTKVLENLLNGVDLDSNGDK